MKKLVCLLMVCLMTAGSFSPMVAFAENQTEIQSSSTSDSKLSESESEHDANTPETKPALPSNEAESQVQPETKPSPTPEPAQVEVADWESFLKAYNSSATSVIKLTADVTGITSAGLQPRNDQLTIEGQGHAINLRSFYLPYGLVREGGLGQIIVRNTTLNNAKAEPGFFATMQPDQRDKWRFVFDTVNGVQTVAFTDATEGKVTLLGTNQEPSKKPAVSESDISSEQKNKSQESRKPSNDEKSKVKESSKKVKDASANVENLTEFIDALKDTNVDVINITKDINGGKGTLPDLKRTLTINGNGHLLNLGSLKIEAKVPTSGTAKLTINEATLGNAKSGNGFVQSSTSDSGKWTFEFNDITVNKAFPVNRVIDADHAKVIFGGTNMIQTDQENAAPGSLEIKAGSEYIGEIYGDTDAAFYFRSLSGATDTGKDAEFHIGAGAYAQFSNTFKKNGDTAHPIAYAHVRNIVLDEKATLYAARWGADIIRLNNDNCNVLMKENSTMEADSSADTDKYPAINYDGGGRHTFTMLKDSKLRLKANGLYGVIALDHDTEPTFKAFRPGLIDLTCDVKTKNRPPVYAPTSKAKFSVEGTNLSYWYGKYDQDTPPVASTNKLDYMEVNTGSNWTTTPAEFGDTLNKNLANVQRISTSYHSPGALKLASVPQTMGFGENISTEKEHDLPISQRKGKLEVVDSRDGSHSWELTATLDEPFEGQNFGKQLGNILYYRTDDKDDLELTSDETPIKSHVSNGEPSYDLSSEWGAEVGPHLQIPAGVTADSYSGTILWTLKDVY